MSARKSRRRKAAPARPSLLVGVDGEGHDLPDGRHVYTYLAAVDEHGTVRGETRFAPEGLSHDECCAMLLGITPRSALKFSFMFTYDLTKILQALPYGDLYEVFRPDLRAVHVCKTCNRSWGVLEPPQHRESCEHPEVRSHAHAVNWEGRRYSWKYGPFTLSDRPANRKTRRVTTIHDSFKFFQSSFAKALRLWEMAGPDAAKPGRSKLPLRDIPHEHRQGERELRRIEAMKAKRGRKDFGSPAQVMAYCKSECELLAKMMRKVLDTCEDNGIHLRNYYGAGSIASALLRKYKVPKWRGPDLQALDRKHPGLAQAILRAYFGGRSECSTIGAVEGQVWNSDVSSAYPAALYTLPCLKCGRWRFVKGKPAKVTTVAREASLALCHFTVRPASREERSRMAWGPLPYRDGNGSIAYPTGFEGWAWSPEALAAVEGWPELVTLTGAWVYRTRCEHRPFAFMPEVYRLRVALGSGAKGIPFKLGYNATYGKTAQREGKAPFRSWIWAGACTATTRGQILRAVKRARDPWDVLAIATDGIVSRSDLTPQPLPESNGTEDLKKPLGAWEVASSDAGIFLAKPGVYWPLDASAEDVDKFKARGLGRGEVAREHKAIMRAFASWDRTHANVPTIAVPSRRFYGAKSSVLSFHKCSACGQRWAGRPQEGCQNPQCSRFGPRSGLSTELTLDGRGEVDSPYTALLHTTACDGCKRKLARKQRRGRQTCACDGCKRRPVGQRQVSYCGRCARPALGQWAEVTQLVTFDALPKRERDSLSTGTPFARMLVRDVSHAGQLAQSAVYTGATTPEGQASQAEKDIDLEQEDASDGDDAEEGAA